MASTAGASDWVQNAAHLGRIARIEAYFCRHGHGYDANRALATYVQPSGLTIDYGPNALGQPTRAGAFATNVRYCANGGMSGFTYGNGVVHQMTQNARGLPDRSTDSGVGGKVIDDDDDANSNVAAISDGLPAGPVNLDMRDDGLDRVTAVKATSFGNASYVCHAYGAQLWPEAGGYY
ncbi:hypothetical protein ACNPNN_10190 [Stenotrophomonas geniculata]|uniref:hypothetical protein n=1 Tax=Stenotrophomonas geniculata TaxID=86188 RepID=UPI003AAEA69D